MVEVEDAPSNRLLHETGVDPSDVVQKAQAEAARRLDAYLAGPPMPFYLWPSAGGGRSEVVRQ